MTDQKKQEVVETAAEPVVAGASIIADLLEITGIAFPGVPPTEAEACSQSGMVGFSVSTGNCGAVIAFGPSGGGNFFVGVNHICKCNWPYVFEDEESVEVIGNQAVVDLYNRCLGLFGPLEKQEFKEIKLTLLNDLAIVPIQAEAPAAEDNES